MRLYSYVVLRDYGFAPNPFHGWCTLATCKPIIRRTAKRGDWLIGVGAKSKGRGGRLVHAMQVSEAMTFDEYWRDPRFAAKRPNLRGSRKQAYGDNIYHRRRGGGWIQHDSHHSLAGGSANPRNIARDTSTDRVLVAERFCYWGTGGPEVPTRFRDWDGIDLAAGRGHRCNFPAALVEDFLRWLESVFVDGHVGRPEDW